MESAGIIESIGRIFEGVGVFIMVFGAIVATSQFLADWIIEWKFREAYSTYRQSLGRGLLLGLDFLIVGDIIDSIIVSASFRSVGILAVIIAIRFFLSAELEHRISGYWPWQTHHRERT